jgi:CubicO group peptidase (beta-lactamase class C family)
MTMTGYCPTGGNIAATEVSPVTGKAWTGIVHDENARFQNGISGNAGVFSNIRDLIKFSQMLSGGGKDLRSGLIGITDPAVPIIQHRRDQCN